MRWISLTRPDGIGIEIQAEQLVAVTIPVHGETDHRAKTKLWLSGREIFVRENIEVVMDLIEGSKEPLD